MNKKWIWVGNKSSDINASIKLFDSSLCLYGTINDFSVSLEKTRTNNNIKNGDADKFFINQVIKKINSSPESQFVFYNQDRAYLFEDNIIKNHFICINNRELLNHLNNKIAFRKLFAKENFFPNYIIIDSGNYDPSVIINILNNNQCIIQKQRGAGCIGTFLGNKKNVNSIIQNINKTCRQPLIVSEYISNGVDFNRHILVSDNSVIVFPASLQILSIKRQEWIGSDFINASKTIGERDLNVSYHMAKVVGNKIRTLGYRGIAGIDFVYDSKNKRTYTLEINPRFQASSFLLDRALQDCSLPSLFELNHDCFCGFCFNNKQIKRLESIVNNYAVMVLMNSFPTELVKIENSKLIDVVTDDVDKSNVFSEKAYLLKLLFKKITYIP